MKTYYVRERYGKWMPIRAKSKRNAVKLYCKKQGWKRVDITRKSK